MNSDQHVYQGPNGERGNRLSVGRWRVGTRIEVGKGSTYMEFVKLASQLGGLARRGGCVKVHQCGWAGVLVDPFPNGINHPVKGVAVSRGVVGAHRGNHVVNCGQHFRDGGAIEIFLTGEVVVHRSDRNLGGLGYIANGGINKAPLTEDHDGRVDNLVPTGGSVCRSLAQHVPILPGCAWLCRTLWPDDRNVAEMSKATAATRPAHRPSRRTHIVESAMKLFARVSFDDVTVGDIADAADMTPAAVYYHFAGKEQILLEGTQVFSSELVTLARQGVDDAIPVADLMTMLLEHVRQRRTSASVFFINSAGLNLALEAHRKTVRADLADLFADAARAGRAKVATAEAGVMGAALVSLLEVSAVATLGRDRAVKGLGVRGLPTVVADLVKRIVGA